VKRVLMIAYHYPPEGMSSGVLRTLKFSKYLPEQGWQPHVLTLKESFYPVRDEGLLKEIRAEVVVHRTLGLDSSRHLAISGRYLSALSVPDCMVGWLPFGVARGLRIIARDRIDAIYSTSPQPTAHLIAATLKLATKLPWVADFRDPWIEEGWHPRPHSLRYRVEAALESLVMRQANRVTVTTDRLRHEILARYPELPRDRVAVIFNGYDEEDFADLHEAPRPAVFELLHAGLITPEYRDPLPLLRAVRAGLERGTLDPRNVRVTFLGAGRYVSSHAFSDQVRELGLEPVVRVVARVPYGQSLQQMMDAALLLLIQASDDTRNLIPAKAFEYLRSGRPILALAHEGATADLVRETGGGIVVDPREPGSVEDAMGRLYRQWHTHTLPRPLDLGRIRRFDRASLTAELAVLLDDLATPARADVAHTTAARHGAAHPNVPPCP
jgi:glycosyltransferase involved in cell wall biosynthesis